MYKRMDANMFADYLLNMKDNTDVVFATKSLIPIEIGETLENESELEYFWFAEKVWNGKYNSWYILFDYIGGGRAEVISLDFEEDARHHIMIFLDKHYGFLLTELYVEIKEPDLEVEA